jgi:hypothetical protein
LIDAQDASGRALTQLSFTDDRDYAAQQFGLDREFGCVREAQIRKDVSTTPHPFLVA